MLDSEEFAGESELLPTDTAFPAYAYRAGTRQDRAKSLFRTDCHTPITTPADGVLDRVEELRTAASLRRELELFRASLKHLPEGLRLQDTNGSVLYVNHPENLPLRPDIPERYAGLLTSSSVLNEQGALIGTLTVCRNQTGHDTENLLRRVISSLRCVIWEAEVTEGFAAESAPYFDSERKTTLSWSMRIYDEVSARKWLPVKLTGQQSFIEGFYLSRGVEGRWQCDQNAIRALRNGEAGYTQEFRCEMEDGTWRWLLEDVQVVPLTEGELRSWRLTGLCVDITPQKQAEEQLYYQARHDPLTGLPNRTLLMERLQIALLEALSGGSQVAVLFFDLDGFKLINDSLGHHVGDQVLTTVAQRVSRCIRSEDTIARLGGDEFTVVLHSAPDQQRALEVARAIEACLRPPIQVAGRPIFISVSIGIALSGPLSVESSWEDTAEVLVRNADTAMYFAKSSGKAHIELFDPGMSARAVEQLELDADLRRAIERDELELYYQPIFDLVSGQVRAVEALARWWHPVYGAMSPERFIPIAERSDCIVLLGEWVLQNACRQLRSWQKSLKLPIESLTVSVNLAARQLEIPDFALKLADILAETELSAANLVLEVTETMMMSHNLQIRQSLHSLQQAGIRIALDDFGIGYSSMAQLDNLPVDMIKIDRTFIQRLAPRVQRPVQTATQVDRFGLHSPKRLGRQVGAQDDSNAIVQAMIAMARAMDLSITAEGIETAEQLEYLREMGCDTGQGFYFARPLNAGDLAAFLEHSYRHRAALHDS